MTDYIIVGGGSAGCVLANRLSVDPSVQVTLVEAGGRDTSRFIDMPAGYFQLMKTGKIDWGYHTAPQKHLHNRKMFWPRAKVLGGCSAVNGMIYIRGHSSDYDQWAQLGNKNWSYDECLPFFKKSEGWHDGESKFHGGDGPLKTSRYGVRHPIAKAFVEAGIQAGFPYTEDFNGGSQEGFGPCDSTVDTTGKGSVRSSVSRSYIRPIMDRPNLTIITKALATRVLIEKGRAVGIEYVQAGKKNQLRADREVILSGGTINSPQLLQLSGIGDPDHLTSLGIQIVVPLKGVGQNLQDHLVVGIKNRSLLPTSFVKSVKLWNAAFALGRYMLLQDGPAAHHGIEALAFVKTRPERVAPDIQFHLMNIMYDDHGRNIYPEHGFMPCLNISRPQSRGSIMVNSADPTTHPVIQPNYFEVSDDVRTMRDGVKIARDVLAQHAFDPYRGEEFIPGSTVRTDSQIDEFLRGSVESIYHPVGTCKMGSDSLAVVDDRLRVHGIDGLRVVDASVMPTLVTGNTNAPTIMIAERASQFILDGVQWSKEQRLAS